MSADKEDPRYIINRFAWLDNERIKIISIDGIEKIMHIDIRSSDIKKNKVRELACNRIPNFDPELCKKCNIILDLPSASPEDSLSRLQRKYQEYRTEYYLNGRRDSDSLNAILYNVDFGINNGKGGYISNLSFTFLHWRLLEQLLDETLQFNSVDRNQIETLNYNIFPEGNTLLHKFKDKGFLISELFAFC